MSVALKLYEQLTEAPDDKTRARVIADAFERLEERYPPLQNLASSSQIRETELCLQKEIERVRLEIKDLELRMQKEIEGVRLEIKQVEGRLQKEIEGVRLEIKQVEGRLQKEIGEVEVRLTRAIHRQTLWVVGSVGAIVGLIRVLDWLLARLPTV